MKTDIHITQHAADRAVERHGCPSVKHARLRLRRYFQISTRLPWRYGRTLARRCPDQLPRGLRADYRVAGPWLLICRGRRVITTWRLNGEQLATVLCWAATGMWLTD